MPRTSLFEVRSTHCGAVIILWTPGDSERLRDLVGIACRSTKLPEQGPFQYVGFSVGITLIFRSTATYSSGALSFHDHNQYLNMMVNEQVKSECNAAFFSFFFVATIFHCSSWQTQSWLPNVSDGWRTDGWVFLQLSHFWKWFFFSFFCNANKHASKNVSFAFLIGEMFLRAGKMWWFIFFFFPASPFWMFELVLC